MDEGCSIDCGTLMENAADTVVKRLYYVNLSPGKIRVVCGKGNNGGDGYAVCCMLLQRGEDVAAVAVEEPASPLAVKYRNRFLSMGGRCTGDICEILNADTLVDCIFGFSFSGDVCDRYAEAIETVNKSGAFKLSVDLPSGVTADSDGLPGLCVRADATCTFTAFKLALVSYPAKRFCGKVYLEDIGIGASVLGAQKPFADLAGSELLKLLPARDAEGHKGSFGTLASVCGSEMYTGAAVLSTLAALKSGIGLVRLYTDSACAKTVKVCVPEAVVSPDAEKISLKDARATALLLGCGCGREHDDLIIKLLTHENIPTVLDADGINCIAGRIDLYRSVTVPLAVTPHPAEMARLTGKSVEEVNASRVRTALDFAKEYGCVTVLKGAATVTAAPDGRLCINTTGNTGLSKGGSGDVLAGLIASLAAQGVPLYEAARLGVYLHGAAAERLAEEKGVYAMLPSELPDVIGRIMHFG